MSSDRRPVSLVVPVYNEQDLVETLTQRVFDAMDSLDRPWKVYYINDGSSDRTLEFLLKKQEECPQIVVVDLSRNWGHQPALTAGLSIADGAAVILMDGDLQDPPEVIPRLVQAWQNGAEVVVARRKSRMETGIRKFLFPLFYRVLGFLSDFPIPLNAGIFGLLDRRAVDAINSLSETNRYLPGLRSWIGFRTMVIRYERKDRAAGEPKQTLTRLVRYALDAIFSFSYKPLRLALFLGLATSAVALIYGAILFYCRIAGIGMFGMPVVPGYTSTIITILILGGVQLITAGILGEYIGRIYDEVKSRPLFIIQEIHEPKS